MQRISGGVTLTGVAASCPSYYRTHEGPHVLFISAGVCTRVMKQAAALRARGVRVDSLSTEPPARDVFDAWALAWPHDMPNLIAASQADVLHVHNEPDDLVRYAHVASRGRPIVYDCHDMTSDRIGYVDDRERFAFSRADAIVMPGEGYAERAYDRHPWDVPHAVVLSLPMRSDVCSYDGPRYGVVYHGGSNPEIPWKDLTVPSLVFDRRGIPFDVYTDPARDWPQNRGWLRYEDLMRRLPTYEYGWVGTDPASDKYADAVPNKLWEYLASGVVPLLCNAPAVEREAGVGVPARSASEFAHLILSGEINVERERRRALAAARFMDDEIDVLLALYRQVGLSC